MKYKKSGQKQWWNTDNGEEFIENIGKALLEVAEHIFEFVGAC